MSYCYFMVRLMDFDISGRIERQAKQELISKATQAAAEKAMPVEEVLRLFGDLSQVDPVIGIANKLVDIVKDDSKPLSESDKQNFWRIVKYIARANNPRLYMQLGKQVVMRMSA